MRRLLILVWLVYAVPALSQQVMEIIPLRYRMVEQVLPSLQPFVEPGGALSGMNSQLIVRGSRNNIEQIKQALSAIDVPSRRLMIRVSQNRDAVSRQQGAGLSGNVGVGKNVRIIQPSSGIQGSTKIEVRSGDSRVNAQANDSRSTRDVQAHQSVQVVDGGRALSRSGNLCPCRYVRWCAARAAGWLPIVWSIVTSARGFMRCRTWWGIG